jgi:hypothetical protein
MCVGARRRHSRVRTKRGKTRGVQKTLHYLARPQIYFAGVVILLDFIILQDRKRHVKTVQCTQKHADRMDQQGNKLGSAHRPADRALK